MSKKRTVTVAIFAYQNIAWRFPTIFGSTDVSATRAQWEACAKSRRGPVVYIEIPLPKAKPRLDA